MQFVNVVLDFVYVICQKRLSSARLLIKTGAGILAATIGIGSIVAALSYNGISLSTNSNEPVVSPLLINFAAAIGLLSLVMGICLEIYERIWGEAAKNNRSKSIDLRSLNNSHAPKLCDQFETTIDQAGLHDDLYLDQNLNEPIKDWLSRTCAQFDDFSSVKLAKMNRHEPMKPLAMGALAHVPQSFVLGFLVGNRRLVNYYCWNRDNERPQKNKWVDTRDARDRGTRITQDIGLFFKQGIEANNVTKWGLSIEVSFNNDHDHFMKDLNLDAVSKLEVKQKDIGNLFSEVAQVAIVTRVRSYINETMKMFPQLKEIHITITGQASFVMRLGADFNQNHLPTIKIHHFDRNSNNYPWCLVLNPSTPSSVTFKEQ
ncbi:SAVED domain-containing protein [Vibrio parahaemolyticus]|uniref:SAVED domain-containing protein n=1 Tax=Vibrio TaxID=662 RepID=UPI0003FED90F|nr:MULTISPECIES: SAVED domain-containing protein [Vibrio]EGR7950942.1 SAVED domain-containing protein [Vibrio vulnificus]EGQ8923930.1 SAVED domain-containing protein [Vibrio parahaemolyticus]EGR2944433.1 SAVED domain-containing protein [Vibrio parahaemolyticus]EGR3065987.1 SAVED domain-containing protein [Vibrio parahaemolyticus]EHH1215348.1 SAVED domain-containing protein [Vibrio parahaemolyticus]